MIGLKKTRVACGVFEGLLPNCVLVFLWLSVCMIKTSNYV